MNVLRTVVLLSSVLMAACGSLFHQPAPGGLGSQATVSSPSPAETASASVLTATKPVGTQVTRPGPTYVRWAIDRPSGGDYILDLFFDGDANTFLIFDPAGPKTLEVPIAGSGMFGDTTCLAKETTPGKQQNVTWRTIDPSTYQWFIANASTLRVRTTTGGGLVVTLPLTDTGCRAIQ